MRPFKGVLFGYVAVLEREREEMKKEKWGQFDEEEQQTSQDPDSQTLIYLVSLEMRN